MTFDELYPPNHLREDGLIDGIRKHVAPTPEEKREQQEKLLKQDQEAYQQKTKQLEDYMAQQKKLMPDMPAETEEALRTSERNRLGLGVNDERAYLGKGRIRGDEQSSMADMEAEEKANSDFLKTVGGIVAGGTFLALGGGGLIAKIITWAGPKLVSMGFNFVKGKFEGFIKELLTLLESLLLPKLISLEAQLVEAKIVSDQTKYKQLLQTYGQSPQYGKLLQNISALLVMPKLQAKPTKSTKAKESLTFENIYLSSLREDNQAQVQLSQKETQLLNAILQADKAYYQQLNHLVQADPLLGEFKQVIPKLSNAFNFTADAQNKGQMTQRPSTKQGIVGQTVDGVKNVVSTIGKLF
jgi:hypothetical protein